MEFSKKKFKKHWVEKGRKKTAKEWTPKKTTITKTKEKDIFIMNGGGQGEQRKKSY